MTVAAWKAATLYLPGDILRSTAAAPVTNQAITNPGFESGDTAWTKSNTTIENVAGFTGSWRAKMVYASGATGYVRTSSILPIAPGQSVSASCMYNPSGASIGVGGQVRILWYDASNAYISGKDSIGNGIDVSNGSGWRKSSVVGSAPSNAKGFRVQGDSYNGAVAGVVLIDAFALSVAGGPAANNLIFKATQTDPATSGTSEPVWPTTVGGTVVDGGVTWTAIDAVVITWEASPILKSGATEPTWPTNIGDTVADGSIAWEVVSRRIEDENCPNSKVVLILSSKVYATDDDIVRFSATANPKDWTSMQDAGYLPTGLQSANANDMAVLAQYRGNLVPMNANCMQNWQVDPDPAAMAILDQMEGIGSTWNKAAQPVANDLFYLSQLGVRSIGISASTDNLAAGDVGMPIDELVQAALDESVALGMAPLSTYYPGAGQYWLAFPQLDAVACSVSTTFQGGQAVPSITPITVGSATGPMLFHFATGFCPDRAEVWLGGVMVLDTGWWGDPSWQDSLDSACAAVGIASGTINAIPNLTHDAYEQWDANEAATFVVDKNVGDTTAIVKVYAPVGGTAWKFRLGCPNDLTLEPKPAFYIAGNVPDGFVGDAVSGNYVVSGGIPPYGNVTVSTGTFPPGLTLNADGSYSGTLSTVGSYSWTVHVTDAAGQVATVADSCDCISAPLMLSLNNEYLPPYSSPTLSGVNQFPDSMSNNMGYDTSADGKVIAIYGNTNPLRIHRWNGSAWAAATLDVATPANSSNPYVQVSGDGTWVLLTLTSGGHFYSYQWDGTQYVQKSTFTLPIDGGGHGGWGMVLAPTEDAIIVTDNGVIRRYPFSKTTGALGTPTSVSMGFGSGTVDLNATDWVGNYFVGMVGTGGAVPSIFDAATLARIYTFPDNSYSSAWFSADGNYLYHMQESPLGTYNLRASSWNGTTLTTVNTYTVSGSSLSSAIAINKARNTLLRAFDGKIFSINGGTLTVLGTLPSWSANNRIAFTNLLGQ